jgi:mannose-6-phosphate isomerase-like protein (cupin superfamily)
VVKQFGSKVMIVKPKIVNKNWGKEIWIHNDEEYCGKILVFDKKDSKFSMHYHIIKKESWYVGRGSFRYIWIDTETAEENSTIIGVGTCITIERGQPHQLIALEDNSEIFEVSTEHFDPDSYRIRKGDSQK